VPVGLVQLEARVARVALVWLLLFLGNL
jgi:hypothetical protein